MYQSLWAGIRLVKTSIVGYKWNNLQIPILWLGRSIYQKHFTIYKNIKSRRQGFYFYTSVYNGKNEGFFKTCFLVFLPTFTCLMLQKRHLNIFLTWLWWPDFQQLGVHYLELSKEAVQTGMDHIQLHMSPHLTCMVTFVVLVGWHSRFSSPQQPAHLTRGTQEGL